MAMRWGGNRLNIELKELVAYGSRPTRILDERNAPASTIASGFEIFTTMHRAFGSAYNCGRVLVCPCWFSAQQWIVLLVSAAEEFKPQTTGLHHLKCDASGEMGALTMSISMGWQEHQRCSDKWLSQSAINHPVQSPRINNTAKTVMKYSYCSQLLWTWTEVDLRFQQNALRDIESNNSTNWYRNCLPPF